MKRAMILLVFLAVLLGGCGVVMTPQYGRLHDQAVILDHEAAVRGTIRLAQLPADTPAEARELADFAVAMLRRQYVISREFQDARKLGGGLPADDADKLAYIQRLYDELKEEVARREAGE